MKLRRYLFQNSEPGDTGGTDAGAGPADVTAPPAGTDASPAPAPVAPTSMHDAMFPKEPAAATDAQPTDPATGQPRDAAGKFVKPVDPAAPAVDPTKPPAPPAPEDLTKPPEGLSKPAAERFQKLANANKELTEQHQQVLAAVEPFRAVLAENAVRQDQFEQAAGVIGMMNKGDYEGALKALDEQRRLIALAIGKPLPGVDALSEFADLRQAVDTMQITEDHALEIAKGRTQQQAQARQMEQRRTQQAQQQQTQQTEQAVQTGLKAVDAFTNEMKAKDLDFAAIEARLLPRIPELIAGVPPDQWAAKVQTLYQLIKESAGVRQPAPHVASLRPTGNPSPRQQPKTMFESMWGTTAPT